MSEALVESFMQLQRKIVDPQDVFDQANGCRGMLLMIEALFRQGKLTQEARDYLHIHYTALLDTLWNGDLGKEHEKLQPGNGTAAQGLEGLLTSLTPLKLEMSPIITEETLQHTIENALRERKPRKAAIVTPTPLLEKQSETTVPPVPRPTFTSARTLLGGTSSASGPSKTGAGPSSASPGDEIWMHPEMEGVSRDVAKRVLSEMMTAEPNLSWDGVAGLKYAKDAVREMIVWPLIRPDIFTGAREPPKGMLLFGPPGTGKTLIGKCIAAEAKATFFSISASTLVSKWVGESNQLVRALFAVARAKQPSVIFLDELDSLLSARREQDHKHDRQLITELFVQLDGARNFKENRVIFIGATNRPFDLDDAARRRLVKRLYIALPDQEARAIIVKNFFKDTKHSITDEQLKALAERTEGYSGADMANLCKEAALAPIRDLSENLVEIKVEEIRAVTFEDLLAALSIVKATVSKADLDAYADWDEKFGCSRKWTKGQIDK